ncbi:hypothetical protein BpHYR1_012149 [Brachionus plicatilis]|uniref:Uncharacterized protein n=1 Tax=Brachionus plicatilis TaxID=10195 RepID=A0A3M7R8N2_BRAPC|nr:hypothetical protein BpHYR1_012149 [Brachionus plicatilis]
MKIEKKFYKILLNVTHLQIIQETILKRVCSEKLKFQGVMDNFQKGFLGYFSPITDTTPSGLVNNLEHEHFFIKFSNY